MCDKMKSVRWVFDCTSWKPTYSDMLLATSCIQQEERNRIEKFVFQRDVKSSLVGRLMMRKYISEVVNKSWNEITIIRDSNGKPYYKNCEIPLHFNVSHQGRYTVLAGDVGEIALGVDVMEREYSGGKKLNDFFRLMERNFATDEWQAIRASCNERNQVNAFFRFWCLKESFVKATGTGITVDLRKICFKLNAETLEVNNFINNTEVFIDSVKQNNWIFQETLLPNNHCCAVAVNFKNKTNNISLAETFSFINFEELVKKAKPILNEDGIFCSDFFKKDINPN